MPLNVTRTPIRRSCRKDLHDKLKALGVKTSGSDTNLEYIIKKAGFKFPEYYDKDYYGFVLDGKWVRLCFNYADCLAEELILIKQLGFLKQEK